MWWDLFNYFLCIYVFIYPCIRLLLFKVSQRITFTMKPRCQVSQRYLGVLSTGLVPAHLLNFIDLVSMSSFMPMASLSLSA